MTRPYIPGEHRDSEDVPFAVRRGELKCLAMHYLEEHYQTSWDWKALGATGSWRCELTGAERLTLLQKALGTAEYLRAVAPVIEAWEQELDRLDSLTCARCHAAVALPLAYPNQDVCEGCDRTQGDPENVVVAGSEGN